jgi:hypothetical protein
MHGGTSDIDAWQCRAAAAQSLSSHPGADGHHLPVFFVTLSSPSGSTQSNLVGRG